jgi:beta-N-acetylhexosaminidase
VLNRYCFVLILALSFVDFVQGQSYQQRQENWVSTTLSNMTLEQKIGQLFIIRAYSKGDPVEEQTILKYINDYHIGGICFFQGSPQTQISLINQYQSRARVPMFMALDAEWGLGMRFPKDAISFPKHTTLGAIADSEMLYEMGREVGKQCKAVGINVNFAPVVDVNNNPNNPVIYDRSFGDDPNNVTTKAYAYLRGLEEEGVLAVLKHFPGHGDTNVDSHEGLPRINHDRARLEAVEMFPFRRLATLGASSMMIGHLNVPSLDSKANIAASMSPQIIKNILRSDMGFNGLIVTDAMDMQAITKYYGPGTAEAEAFLAGNDVILLPENLPKAFSMIKQYVDNGRITVDKLNESVTRILNTKFKLGLTYNAVISANNVADFIQRNEAYAIKQKLYEKALTVVSDNEGLVPILDNRSKSIATLSINVHTQSAFQNRINDYAQTAHYQWMPSANPAMGQQMLQTLSQFETVIVAVHTSGKRNDFSRDLNAETVRILQDLNAKTKLIIVVFGHPYILSKLSGQDNVICAYENDELAQDAAAQGLFGAIEISGTLPVGATNIWRSGQGQTRKSLDRLGFSLPEQVGMSSQRLSEIDRIAKDMLAQNATPGAQILVARHGRIVHSRAYGVQSPGGSTIKNNTMYDVASITKILATTAATMKLVDEGRIDINATLDTYIPNIDTSSKAKLIVEDVLSHNARLPGGIVSYQSTVLPRSQSYNGLYYRSNQQDNYIVPVARNMFMRYDYKDSLWRTIVDVPLRSSDSYRYSDVGLMLIQRVLEEVTGTKLNDYTHEYFYKPMGLRYTTFLPLEKHPIEYIAPSEVDNYFRMQTVHGHVHDMTAAMMGGVGGHAGLFSTAYETGMIMQMFLNKGSYGGVQYIRPETIKKFTTRHRKSSRRGLGFDMKELDSGRSQNMSHLASASAFGHIGFTGGAAFADPKEELIFIILTNRTFPSQRNQTYNNKDYRLLLHTAAYEAIVK